MLHPLWKLAAVLGCVSPLEITYYWMIPAPVIQLIPDPAVMASRSELHPFDLERAVKITLDRPLFEPGRRPKTDQTETAPLLSEDPIPRLAGIIVNGTHRTAIFDYDRNTPGALVNVDKTIDSYVGSYIVHEIRIDGVTLLREGKEIRLKLRFRSKLPETALSTEPDVEKIVRKELGL